MSALRHAQSPPRLHASLSAGLLVAALLAGAPACERDAYGPGESAGQGGAGGVGAEGEAVAAAVPEGSAAGHSAEASDPLARRGRPEGPEQPLAPGARRVELRMNGQEVSVVRPSAANPFVVAAGRYEASDAPVTDAGSQPEAPSLRARLPGPVEMIRRVPTDLPLLVDSAEGVGALRGFYVAFEGYPGHFFVETEPDSELFGEERRPDGAATLHFFIDEVFPPGERDAAWGDKLDTAFDVTMRVWPVDRANRVGAPASQVLHVLPVGRGELEVTLQMDQATDLDLYVVEPNGNVLYYANMGSYTGGRLDLDANAACNGNMGRLYEHVFWPDGGVPEGTYRVRVDNWMSCVGGADVPYRVVVQNCGDISIFEGVARGAGGRADCRAAWQPSCSEVAAIEVRPCADEGPTAQAPGGPPPR